MRHFASNRTLGKAIALCLLLVLCVAGLSGTASAATDPLVSVPGNIHPLLQSGRGAPTSAPAVDPEIGIGIDLALRNGAALEARAIAAATPGNAQYGHWVSDAEYLRDYAPLAADTQRVVAYLRSMGLTDIDVDDSRLLVTAGTTVSHAAAVFHTPISFYTMAGGRVAYANTAEPQLPASIARITAAVLGLNNLTPRVPANKRGSETWTSAPRGNLGNKPNDPPSSNTPAARFFTAPDLQAAYRTDLLYAGGVTGKGGKPIGIATLADFYPKDIVRYAKEYATAFPDGAPKVKRVIVKTGKDPITFDGYEETTLDAESSITMAPGAGVNVYVGANTDAGFQKVYLAGINAGLPAVSASWGQCEEDLSTAQVAGYHAIFVTGASKGTTLLNSSGDSGYAECGAYPGTNPPAPRISVSHPASDPFMLAVGGTDLYTTTSSARASFRMDHEEIWTCKKLVNDVAVPSATPEDCNRYTSVVNGGAGGGISKVFDAPDYQKKASITSVPGDGTNGTIAVNGKRVLPDISMDGGPYGRFIVGVTDKTFTPPIYEYAAYYGTSLASPLMAGTLTLAANYHGGKYGLVQETLYSSYNTAYPLFTDITKGNNGYDTGVGFDAASGLGGVGAGGNIGADYFVAALGVAKTKDAPVAALSYPEYTGIFFEKGTFGTGKAIKATISKTKGSFYGTPFNLNLYVGLASGKPVKLSCTFSNDVAAWLATSCPATAATATVARPSVVPLTLKVSEAAKTYSTVLTVTLTTADTTPATFTYKVPITLNLKP